MLPSISTETNVSARSRSSALVSLVSSARFQELSSASTCGPSSLDELWEDELCAAARPAPRQNVSAIARNGFIVRDLRGQGEILHRRRGGRSSACTVHCPEFIQENLERMVWRLVFAALPCLIGWAHSDCFVESILRFLFVRLRFRLRFRPRPLLRIRDLPRPGNSGE